MITIVTPVFNGSAYISDLCEMMIRQEGEFEHILQIHNSDARAYAIAQTYLAKYNLKIFFEADSGIYDAVRRGFARASGDILGWLGVDDTYFPGALNTVASVFDRNPHVSWITGAPNYRQMGPRGFETKCPCFLRIYPPRLIAAGYYAPGELNSLQQESMFWRKKLWVETGAEEIFSRYSLAGDYWLWRAFAKRTPLYTVPAPMAAFTIRADQASKKFRDKYLAECGVSHSRLSVYMAKIYMDIYSLTAKRYLVEPF